MLVSHSVKMMGTTIDIAIHSNNPKNDIQEVCHLLTVYNKRFSANDDDSELMMINRQAGIGAVKVHPELFELIKLGKEHSLAEPSNLNIAIGPLVQSWRIGFDDATVPSSETISEKLALTNPELIQLDSCQKSVFLSQKGMKIDLGALAKGYIADRIIQHLSEKQVTAALINLGGNVLVHGSNPNREDGSWWIGIQKPEEKRGTNVGVLAVTNQSVVTSGIYERHLLVDGQDYHHIFDKKTGYPIETDMASLTIVSDLSTDCEIWTTRLFGLPIIQAMMTINEIAHIEGIIITKDNRLIVSEGLKQHFRLYY
ncbi:FAD:protein FMN transferase [Streptococcus saliviloxodontae]|uniref:FAD:protein FMN transferase n=1 Tax=Streptococcus saliviloxodontae TaxID=1349416 RepID=A0ABS2PL13_9STRE|nr:FAD:protein FMN transferase [Streptococcus saliviloxodontae]MBM7636124.1 thiamine biosynthesis lipoprotein [Streptococcus saliviloxodontae]